MIKLTRTNKFYNRGKVNQIHVINNIDLELPDSGMVAIYGRSGCGKTTLLNAIGGLDSIDSGVITVFGKDIGREDTDYIRNKYIGYIFQNYNLCKDQTVYENVANALRLCGMTDEAEIRERVFAALSNVGMDKFFKRLPDALSGGQQQRVAIARAIVKNPAIILADEPTGNLDEANTILVMDMLKEISREHLVLLVTHESKLVDYYCDRVIEIVDGQIASERENTGAEGYNKRDQNKIYLGELEHRSFSVPGAKIEFYGDIGEDIKLSVVSSGGKLFLKSDSPSLRILDSSSEIRLVEGVFEEKKASENRAKIDMSKLTPVTSEKYGRLFGFKQSLTEAFRINFTEKVKKKNKFLRAMMFIFAAILVFSTSNFAVFFRQLHDVNKTRDPDAFYLKLNDKGDADKVSAYLGQHGIEGLGLEDDLYSQSEMYFSIKHFMSANNSSIPASGRMHPASEMPENAEALAGELKFENPGDTVISSAMADDMIKNAGVGYIDEYSDLIGLISDGSYGMYGINIGRVSDDEHRIVGVIASDISCYYLTDLEAAKQIIGDHYINNVIPASDYDLCGKDAPARGDIYIYYRDDISGSDGKLTIAGKEYNIAYNQNGYTVSDYPTFVYQQYGEKLLSVDDYIKENKDTGLNGYQLSCKWYFEYFLGHFNDYLKFKLKNRTLDELEWAAYKSSDTVSVIITSVNYIKEENTGFETLSMSPDEIYCAYLYHNDKGEYPESKDALYGYTGTPDSIAGKYGFDNMIEYMKQRAYDIFEQTQNEYYSMNYYYGYNSSAVVMNDEDYMTLAYSTADSDYGLSYFDSYFEDAGLFTRFMPSLYLRVRSSDLTATEEFLRKEFADNDLITPDGFYSALIADSLETIIGNAVSLLIVLGLMSLCIFFIMRSSFMSRVREIGIYRAIGVSKKNLIFRYLVETLLITSLTVLIGYLVSSLLMGYLSTTVIISNLFYYPLWIALILLAVIYGVCTLFGTLPIMLLMKKTPSQILAKYDI